MIKTSAALALLASLVAGCAGQPEDDSFHQTWSETPTARTDDGSETPITAAECDLRRLETPISVLERTIRLEEDSESPTT